MLTALISQLEPDSPDAGKAQGVVQVQVITAQEALRCGVRCELPKPAGQHAQECMVMAGEGGEGQDTLL